MTGQTQGIGWFAIVRLGTVQAAIGAMVMLATSLLNRIMVVEYAIAAAVPAGLVAWHYAVQMCRPLFGHRSDQSARRSPWIIFGMGILAFGTLLAVDSAIFMSAGGIAPFLLAIVGFTLIGVGVGMSGTALLALLASRVAPERKPAAAAISWTMMVAGIVIAAATTGQYLEDYSEARLAIICSLVALFSFLAAIVALAGLGAGSTPVSRTMEPAGQPSFTDVFREIRSDAQAWRFTLFVFISMLAYSMQDLILEPFAGIIFAMTPGASTKLASVQHGGVLAGMLLTGAGGTFYAKRFGQNVKLWIILGCFASALMLCGMAAAAHIGEGWPIRANVFALGLANGVFAVAAVGAMLGLASEGKAAGEGARMGVWGAAQAIAFGTGGLVGALLVDQLRRSGGADGMAFGTVFALEAAMFVIAALVAVGTRLTKSSGIRRTVEA